MVDYAGLMQHLARHPHERLGLVSHQALDTDARLYATYPQRLAALFSAEHGWFGLAAPGEKTSGETHPFWHIPVHSLYGATRAPTPEMLAGIDRLIVDLQDLGVRCYTYLATMRLVLHAAAAAGIPVTVLDRPVPLGGVVDGPGRAPDYASFVAPADVPLCHGMTTGEYATFLVREEALEVDLTVIRLRTWSHRTRTPWPGFLPPSPGIRTWDSAVFYPVTLFTEAYPAVDCDRAGPLSFRVLGAPWLDGAHLLKTVSPALTTCGVGLRPYRYRTSYGRYAGQVLDGVMVSVANAARFRPVEAGTRLFAALAARHPEELATDARPDWFDKLWGAPTTREAVAAGALDDLFASWRTLGRAWTRRRVKLYA